ncbi:MAG TPA: DNA polymerase IV, partial [Polyangia bacterium]|nr:DNA polymerase IV [Polyangia bacterium]
ALAPHLHAQATRVARRLRQAEMQARTVQLKLKLSDFTLVTRRLTLPQPTDDGQALFHAAQTLLERMPAFGRARLTGVSAQELVAQGAQMGLFAPPPSRSARLNAALDRINSRFGGDAIATADVASLGERGDLPRGKG